MRVIAGIAKGRKLKVPAGKRVRPTADRVKEALFDILGDRVRGMRVLDLYAGAGSLSIEALSRGAARAVMVEASAAAVSAIEANLAATGFSDQARVIRAKAESAVWSVLEKGASFDLIFADPPYNISGSELSRVFSGLTKRDLLVSSSVLVLESSSKKPVSEFGGFIPRSVRVYGDTSLVFYARAQNKEGES